MTTVQQLYEAMQHIAPLELAESWDNPGLLVDCGGEVTRVLVTLDITPEVPANRVHLFLIPVVKEFSNP